MSAQQLLIRSTDSYALLAPLRHFSSLEAARYYRSQVVRQQHMVCSRQSTGCLIELGCTGLGTASKTHFDHLQLGRLEFTALAYERGQDCIDRVAVQDSAGTSDLEGLHSA